MLRLTIKNWLSRKWLIKLIFETNFVKKKEKIL